MRAVGVRPQSNSYKSGWSELAREKDEVWCDKAGTIVC